MSLYAQIIIFMLIEASLADVQVFFTNGMGQMVDDFPDIPAAFGDPVPIKGIAAFVVYSNPEDACSPIDPPPRNITNFTKHWAVLIKRAKCTFGEKILAAQNANFDLAIVHNNESDDLKSMHANHPEKVIIPSVFVGLNTGHVIKERYLYDKGYLIRISEDASFDFNTQMLIPFLIVISFCLITMLGFLIVKCVKDRRRARRRKLPNSSLRKIPTAKYRKGDPYETCAICLDDYIEGEKLRILPCSHAYHSKCIDPWLTRNRRVCPMCKRKVFAAGERAPSDSDSASEDDDHTPLLRTAQQTHAGTFTSVFAVAIVNNRTRSINSSDDQEDTSSTSSIISYDSAENNHNRIEGHSPPIEDNQEPSSSSLSRDIFDISGDLNSGNASI